MVVHTDTRVWAIPLMKGLGFTTRMRALHASHGEVCACAVANGIGLSANHIQSDLSPLSVSFRPTRAWRTGCRSASTSRPPPSCVQTPTPPPRCQLDLERRRNTRAGECPWLRQHRRMCAAPARAGGGACARATEQAKATRVAAHGGLNGFWLGRHSLVRKAAVVFCNADEAVAFADTLHGGKEGTAASAAAAAATPQPSSQPATAVAAGTGAGAGVGVSPAVGVGALERIREAGILPATARVVMTDGARPTCTLAGAVGAGGTGDAGGADGAKGREGAGGAGGGGVHTQSTLTHKKPMSITRSSPPPHVDDVVDTNGCGDAFVGGFIAAMCRGLGTQVSAPLAGCLTPPFARFRTWRMKRIVCVHRGRPLCASVRPAAHLYYAGRDKQ